MTPTADFDLSSSNSFGLSARAAWACDIHAVADLALLFSEPCWRALPHLVLGGGSNILFTSTYQGLVLRNRIGGRQVTEQADAWLLHIGAGENWHDLVQWTLQQNMPGLENLALIPGTVGAAPVQNIGAYGVEFCQFCNYVEAWDLDSQQLVRLSATDCAFGYRESRFKHAWQDSHIITAVGLRLPKHWQPHLGYGPLKALGEHCSAQQIFQTVCETRQSKLPDPAKLGNAGSFFKNPVIDAVAASVFRQQWPEAPFFLQADGSAKLAAGWLIDHAGLKGFTLGGAAVHRLQALVLVNQGGATAQDILALAWQIRARVQQQFGVRLEPEVRFIGARGETHLDEAYHDASLD